MEYFIVTETQINNGTPSALVTVFNDKDNAFAKYFTILSAAAISKIELHGAIIETIDGVTLESYVFDRREEE